MDTTPTPDQAADLLAQVEANERHSRTGDAWPLVTLFFVLSAGLSVGLVAIGVIDDVPTQLIVFFAGLAWLGPALVVYLVKALSWSRRSGIVLFTWLGLILLGTLAGIIADSYATTTPVPYVAAGLLWFAAPVFSFLALRR
ncbi:hypothetical protein [Brevibacterium renqingii]|uniref:hypothetical protein n=1 Tax=Brevibacterium renqingii TaxID=2776916 RepID=UPI001ADFAEA7|nr:hypothetical protein [Brevibacterium renqingii]